MRGLLTKEDFVLGALDRLAVRGIEEDEVIALMRAKLGYSKAKATQLARHWFNQQYKHGMQWRRSQWVAKAKGA